MKKSIVIDNGGSELRYISDLDTKEIYTLGKNVSLYNETQDLRIKDGVEPYDIVAILRASAKEYEGIYLTGNAYYSYNGSNIDMLGKAVKSDSPAWYRNMIIAIAKDAMNFKRSKLDEARAVSQEVTDSVEHEFDAPLEYSLTTLIPVNEFQGAVNHIDKLKKNLAGTYEAMFPAMTDGCDLVKFTLTEDDIKVASEGVVSILALRTEVKPSDFSLIIDIGHNTTDICICKGTTLLSKGVITSEYAGGTLLAMVRDVMRNHNIGSCEDDMAVETLRTGCINIGSRSINIQDEIDVVKQNFVSTYIVGDIVECIKLVRTVTSNIRYIVPIGAILGSKNKSTGKYDILEDIARKCELSNSEIKIVSDDLRYVNINMAAALAKAHSKSK